MPNEENFRFRTSAELKDRWVALCEKKRIKQQEAINQLLAWVVEQDSLVQSLIFGQIELKDRPDIAVLVMERLAKGGQLTNQEPRLVLDEEEDAPDAPRIKHILSPPGSKSPPNRR